MPKEPELITCPNPECRRKFRELVVVNDVSTTPVKRFHACPHCFFELDEISAESLRKEERRKKEEKKRKEEKKEKRKIKPDVDAENKEDDMKESAPSPPTHPSLERAREKLPDLISAQPQKEEKEKKKEKGPSGCPHHFGYLASRPKNARARKPIPQECLTCLKVLDCMMKSIDNKTSSTALVKSH